MMHLSKGLLRAVTCGAVALACGGSMTPASAADLRLYNWADYVDEEVIARFTKETGITVALETYSEGGVAEARLLAGGNGFDLAIVPFAAVGRLIEGEAIQPLDQSRVLDPSRITPAVADFLGQYGPDVLDHSLTFLWGHTGLAVDARKVRDLAPDVPLDSWRLVFDPEVASVLAECGIGMVDSVDEVVAAALTYLGRDPSSTDPNDIEDAFAAISAIVPYVSSFDSSHYDELIEAKLCVALTWSSEGVAVEYELEHPPYKFHTPSEGATAWFDVFVLPSDAPNVDAAYRLMEFIYRPSAMGAMQSWGYGATVVNDAQGHLYGPLVKNEAISPSDEMVSQFHTVPSWSGAQKAELDAMWRRVLLGS